MTAGQILSQRKYLKAPQVYAKLYKGQQRNLYNKSNQLTEEYIEDPRVNSNLYHHPLSEDHFVAKPCTSA